MITPGNTSTPPTNPIFKKLGRRMNDDSQLTFPVAISKTAVWLLGGMLTGNAALLAWLAIQQMEQGKVLVRMDERSQITKEQMQAFHSELERLTLTDNRLSLELKRLQIAAAQHGWKDGGE
jgi:hypothetical protein